MDYDFHKGDWVLSCAMPYPQFVKIKEEDTDVQIVADIQDFANDRITTAIIDWEELEPIPIDPDTLEAFGFNEGVLNNSAQPCWSMWWKENDTQTSFDQTSIEIWPENFQDTNGTDWMCRINRQLNNCLVQVRNIHEIQHCMRVAGIKKELEFKKI